MSLKNGIYNIRYVPEGVQFPFFGGVYATGDLVNAPVHAEALNPATSSEQKWQVQATGGAPNTYLISIPGFNPNEDPVLPGFGVGKFRNRPEPVMLTIEISEWLLIQVDAENGVYNIQAPNGLVGAAWAVNEEQRMLLLKPYPFYEDSPPLPRWQFVPIEN